MTKALRFLRRSWCHKPRPSLPKAPPAHLRLYSAFGASQSVDDAPGHELQQEPLPKNQISFQDRLYPRIPSQRQAVGGAQFRSRYGRLDHNEVDENGEVILRGISQKLTVGCKLMLSGRVVNQRAAGFKLHFLELQQQDGRPIQIVYNYSRLQDQSSIAAFRDSISTIKRGDIYSEPSPQTARFSS